MAKEPKTPAAISRQDLSGKVEPTRADKPNSDSFDAHRSQAQKAMRARANKESLFKRIRRGYSLFTRKVQFFIFGNLMTRTRRFRAKRRVRFVEANDHVKLKVREGLSLFRFLAVRLMLLPLMLVLAIVTNGDWNPLLVLLGWLIPIPDFIFHSFQARRFLLSKMPAFGSLFIGSLSINEQEVSDAA